MSTKGTLRDNNFRELVKACAADPETVAIFNKTHGTNMKCPIVALVEPVFPLEMSEDERDEIALFVAWVQHNWQRLRAAAQHVAKLKSFYDGKRGSTKRVH